MAARSLIHSAPVSALLCPSCACCAELLPESSPTLKLMKSQLNNLGPSCVASGDAVLSLYNTYQLPYAAYVMILLGFFVALLLLTYGAIWRLARHRT